MEPSQSRRTCVVVGGGIAGLVAARHLVGADAGPVTLLDPGPLGGKIRSIRSDDGIDLELGADSFLAAKPAAADLATELGLDLAPSGPQRRTYLQLRGRLRPLPDGLAMGIPAGFGAMTACLTGGLLGPGGALRAALEPLLPRTRDLEERSVGEVLRSRLGPQATDRLVAPLTTGVFGAPPDELGFIDTMPHLASGRSLVLAMGRRPKAAAPTAPFVTVRGGLQRLIDALVDDLSSHGAEIRAGAATGIERGADDGWLVTTTDGSIPAAAVVLATPAADTARVAAGVLDAEAVASLGGVTAHPSAVFLVRFSGPLRLDGSGYLVAPEERAAVAACTWLPSKWPHHGWGDPWVRAVVTDAEALAMTDEALTDRVCRELRSTLAPFGPPEALEVRETIVHRWEHAIPVYAPGHRRRMRQILDDVPSGLALAGAAYAGPGISDCIGSAKAAAETIVATLSHPR